MSVDWPEAFLFAVLIISTLAFLAYDHRLRAEVMKEAIRNGADHVKIR